MNIRKSIVLFLLILFGSVCYGEDKKMPDFDVMTVPTGLDREMDVWYKTPPDSAPRISSVSEVTKGQKFQLALFFSGYELDKDGKANVIFDIRIKKPDSSVYFERNGLNGIARAVQPNVLLLSEAVVGASFDPPDPWGEYKIEITARDTIAKKSKTQSIGITLSPWQLGNAPGSAEEFDKWSKDYHVSPKPNEAVYAFIAHCPLTDNKGELAVAGLYLFKVIFAENPYLAGHLAAQFKSATQEQQQKIIVLLHLLGKLDKIAIPAGLAEFKSKATKIALPDPYGETLSGHQQDMLWTEFLATGRIRPVRKLITNLEYSKYTGSIDGFKKSKQTDEDKMNVYREAIFQSAVWSLTSNCKQHELVAKYCIFLYEHGDLSANEKKLLGMILSRVFDKGKDKKAGAKDLKSGQR